jgi:hypothetical protein
MKQKKKNKKGISKNSSEHKLLKRINQDSKKDRVSS